MLQEDDEHTIDEDEAQITEAERNEELAALQAEADLPLDDILKMYTETKGDLQQSSLLPTYIILHIEGNSAAHCFTPN
jgi:hypothetical protein